MKKFLILKLAYTLKACYSLLKYRMTPLSVKKVSRNILLSLCIKLSTFRKNTLNCLWEYKPKIQSPSPPQATVPGIGSSLVNLVYRLLPQTTKLLLWELEVKDTKYMLQINFHVSIFASIGV